jgi:Cu2+-exporting ATPase
MHKLSCTEITGSLSESKCLDIVAGLEAASEHPLSKALSAASETPENLVQLRSESGKGVEGKLNNKKYRVGSSDYVAEIIGDKLPRSKMTTDSHLSAVYFGRQSEWLAVLFLEDEIRAESKNAIKLMKALGLKVSLLSGDSINAVKSVAETLGIENYQPRLLPADKLNALQKMQSRGHVVAMIGDGVNDAPVLAAANVSIAMGKGSQLAQASADMILLNENLNQLPFAFDLARRMQAVIRQNFSWAIVYNLVAIPIAAMGFITPWMAAIGMSLSSILVVLNALRLK